MTLILNSKLSAVRTSRLIFLLNLADNERNPEITMALVFCVSDAMI